jgi:hypothetical protein
LIANIEKTSVRTRDVKGDLDLTSKYERTKRLVITGYAVFSTLILWGMSRVDMQTMTGASLIRFASFFWVGGFAFHYLSRLLSVPATQNNWGRWLELARHLFWFFVIAGGSFFIVWVLSRLVLCGGLPPWLYVIISLTVLAGGFYLSVKRVGAFHDLLGKFDLDAR